MSLRVAATAVAGVFGQDNDVGLYIVCACQCVTWHTLFVPADSNYPFPVIELDVVLEQEEQHGFRIVGKQHQVDVGLRACRASQHRARQIRMEIG